MLTRVFATPLLSALLLVAGCNGAGRSHGEGDGATNDGGSTGRLPSADDGNGPGGREDSTSGTTQGQQTGGTGGGTEGPSGGMCDPQAQDCPQGEKCTFYRDEANPGGANKCVPVVGTAQVGDPCMRDDGDDTDTCDFGLLCWGTEPDNTTGACVELCDEDEQCSTGDPCTITNGGALPMCLPKCDPLAPECPNGWACYDDWDFSDNWFCDRDRSEDLGVHGDPCETIAGCDPGLICAVAEVVDSQACVASGASGCCTLVCDTTDPITCPGDGEDCVSYYQGSAPPEYTNVGMCAIPQ